MMERPTPSEVRAELEWIWREWPCQAANHKCGWKLKANLSPKIKGEGFLAGGYWLVNSDVLVRTRGRYYPKPKRKSKYTGRGVSYLTPWGLTNSRKQRSPEWDAVSAARAVASVLTNN